MASLIVTLPISDSNQGSGESWLSSDDVIDPSIFMFDRSTTTTTPTIIPAQESILNAHNGSKGNISMIANSVGDTIALCKLLIQRGKLPVGYDKIIIVGTAWAGTAFPGYWAVTGTRYALDGGGGLDHGYIAQVNAALGLDPANRIWFHDSSFGANCGGDASFQSEFIATTAEVRGLRTGASAPILLTPSPPDRANAALGGATSLAALTAIQANCANWLPNSYYIDPTGLPSEMGGIQSFIHYSAASHRGGVDNSGLTTTLYNGSWIWDSTVTYAAGNHVLGSDNFCYNSVGNGNINIDPTTDGGVHWTKTTYQYGRTISNPLSERKYSAIVNNPVFYQFAGSW
jgi:hypothetical protein